MERKQDVSGQDALFSAAVPLKCVQGGALGIPSEPTHIAGLVAPDGEAVPWGEMLQPSPPLGEGVPETL